MTTHEKDKRHLWHPFTPTDPWLDSNFMPPVIERGEGALLIDEQGNRFLDGNSSIWTNLHGHNHPRVNRAICQQLERLAHCSFLGNTHAPAADLAKRLIDLANSKFTRVFFSDDGSTAMEAALKIAFQFFQQNGQPQRQTFLAIDQGYHGDTVGAMSVGQSGVFHETFKPLMFPTQKAMMPGCYRCPFNNAKPEKADARLYRKCCWECLRDVEQKTETLENRLAALFMEPRVQGAAGMVMHPEGYLKKVADIVQSHGALLILDEVMTGFGRTGSMFAFQKENIQPDILALAKGLTAGYLPMAATLVNEEIFNGFRGGIERTFFHGHSYTANPLGCAAALANLDIFEEEKTLARIAVLERRLDEWSQIFWQNPHVGDVRREGLILAVELVEDFRSRRPYPWTQRVGYHVCESARKHGLLTRGVGSILILMPPYCVTEEQLETMVQALYRALQECLAC